MRSRRSWPPPSSMASWEAEAATAEDLAAVNELRASILSSMSHDLRTPLAGIKASATSLLQDDVEWSEEARRELLDDHRRGDRPARPSRRQPARHEPAPGRRRRGRTARCRARRGRLGGARGLGARRARASWWTSPTTSPAVGDAALLERVLANLIDNAVAFPAERPVLVRAGACRAGRRPSCRWGRASRGGAGPRSSCRSSASVTRDGGRASGSGSPSPRGSCEAMGGTIEAADTPGGGLTIVVRLQWRPNDDASWSSTTNRRSCARSASTCGRAATRSTWRRRASRRCSSAAARPSGRGHPRPRPARHRRRRGDRRPARLDRRPDHRAVRARPTQYDKVDALDAGADDYVTKPFGMDELLARHAGRPAPRDPGRRAGRGRRRRLHGRPRRAPGHRAGDEVALTPTEWHLLEVLVRNAGTSGQPAAAAARGVGTGVRDRDELPARLHRPAAPEARARPASRATSSPSPAWATGSSPGPRSEAARRERQLGGPGCPLRLGPAVPEAV